MIWKDGNDGVGWDGGTALIFGHPLRAALRLHASPSRSEGEVLPLPEDFPSPGIFPPRGFSLPLDVQGGIEGGLEMLR